MSDNEKHALLSPSGAERWITCPGSVLMEQGLVDEGSDYSKEGTAAHEYAAIWLTTGLPPILPWKAQNGHEFSNDPDDYEIDAIREYVDQIRAASEGHTLLVEQKLSIAHVTGEEGAEGTGDAVILNADGETMQVRDLKFGASFKNKVYAKENKQLMMYALGSLYQFGALGDFKKFVLAIHQPRLNHLDEWECTLEDLEEFADLVKFRAQSIWRLLKGEVKFVQSQDLVVSEHGCKWCKAQATCPKFVNNALTIAAGDFTVISEHTESKMQAALQKVERLDNQKLAWLLQNADIFEAIAKAARSRALSELSAGRDVPGFKLVQGKQGNRKWIDETLVEAAMKKWRLKEADMYKAKLISPTGAEKLFAKQPKRWKALQAMITRSEGVPSVAASTDTRPVLEAGAQIDDFDAIEA